MPLKDKTQTFRLFTKILLAAVALFKFKLEMALCIYVSDVGLKENFATESFFFFCNIILINR